MKSLEERDKISDIKVRADRYTIDNFRYEWEYICECGYDSLDTDYVFCPMCGQRLRWED